MVAILLIRYLCIQNIQVHLETWDIPCTWDAKFYPEYIVFQYIIEMFIYEREVFLTT